MTDTEYRLRSQNISNQDLAKFNELWPKVQKQAKIKPKFRLPSFDCPNCDAKNILFAGDAVRKNETIMKVLEENDSVDYVIVCPKCKKHIGVRRNAGVDISHAQFRTVGYYPISFERVYNHRLLTEEELTINYLASLLIFPGQFRTEEMIQEYEHLYTVKIPYKNSFEYHRDYRWD